MPDYRCAECGARYYSRAKPEDLRALQDDRCDECGAKLKEVKRHEEDENLAQAVGLNDAGVEEEP